MQIRRLRLVALSTVALTIAAVLVFGSGWTSRTVNTLLTAPRPAAEPAPMAEPAPNEAGGPRRTSPIGGPGLPDGQVTVELTTLLEGTDAPDPFVLVHQGRPWLFTTNTLAGNVPAITLARNGGTSEVDALPVLPVWAEPGYTWAPAVMSTDGGWILAFTARDHASGRQCIGVAVSAAVAGPYVPNPTPLVCDLARGGSIDPSFVVDDQGKSWLLYKDDGNCCEMPTALRAVPLSADGLALAGQAVEILRADQTWENGVIEAPTMVPVDGRWLLLYSASHWDHAGYAVGAAWCEAPTGPCVKQPLPALSLGAGFDGPGGLEFVSGAGMGEGLPVVFHAWPDGPHGYQDGSVRELHVGVVATPGDVVTITSDPATRVLLTADR